MRFIFAAYSLRATYSSVKPANTRSRSVSDRLRWSTFRKSRSSTASLSSLEVRSGLFVSGGVLAAPRASRHSLDEQALPDRATPVAGDSASSSLVIFHVASQVFLVLIERPDHEPPLASGQHIESPIRIPLRQPIPRARGATGIHYPAILRQHDTEFSPGSLRFPNHFLVPILEYMERNRASGEDNELQREEGEQPGHSAIIAFLLLCTKQRFVITSHGFTERKGRHHHRRIGGDRRTTGGCPAEAAALICSSPPAVEARLKAVAAPEDLVVPGDLTEHSVRSALIGSTFDRWGKIDVLITTRGDAALTSTASTTPLDEARAVFELNFFAPLALAPVGGFASILESQRHRSVNISSIAKGRSACRGFPSTRRASSRWRRSHRRNVLELEARRRPHGWPGVFPGHVETDFQAHAPGPRPPDRVVQGKRFAVSAGECAEAIVDGIEHRKRTVVTPRAGWLLVWANRFFPNLVESRLERV